MFICISVSARIPKKNKPYTPTSLQALIRHTYKMTEGSVIIMLCKCTNVRNQSVGGGEVGGGRDELCQPCCVTAAFSQEKCSRRMDAAEKRT